VQVDTATAQEFATSEALDYIETSAKNSTNVENMFKQIAVAIQQRYTSVHPACTLQKEARWLYAATCCPSGIGVCADAYANELRCCLLLMFAAAHRDGLVRAWSLSLRRVEASLSQPGGATGGQPSSSGVQVGSPGDAKGCC
jgi:chorismate mutase